MQTKKQSMHYAWLILIACCMMQGAGLGLISNCAGVFFSPVCNDLGFEMGKFTLFRTLFTMAQALTLPYVAKLFRKYDVRVIISAATVIMGGISILQGTFTSLWQFYVFGIIQGCAAAFIGVIPAPILLGNWFYKNTGTAVGISAAFSGLVGMIGSSALGVLIPAYGWRTSYMIIGVAAMVLILPFSLFILRYKPEDKGMLPYGADENYVSKTDAKAAAKKEKFSDFAKQPIFYISLTAYACSIISSYLNSFLPSCGLEAGLPMAAAALLTSLALCGNMTTKLFLGKLCDSYGVIKIFVLSIVVAIVGHGLIFIGSTAPMMAGALLYGITMPLSTVLMPLFCRLFWKGDTYASAYSYVSMFGMLISA
ncbi:MAG: MFS transporter, partial [Lachnospiraceae bacterium]|nr:MFS transporter [Lachnospiraceae bacterium]